MAKDTATRKWQITINNPIQKGFTHERIKELIEEFKTCEYWCMSDEIGEEGTYHTHLYMKFPNAVEFSKVRKWFDGGHFEMAKGTSQQNRDYVFKEGKWEKDKKKETNLPDTHEEFGEVPVERQGARNDLHDLYDMIKQGMSNYEIIELEPNYMMNIDKIERSRQIIREEKYKNEFRQLDVRYIYGSTGVGKTRGIMEMYGYQNVFRITDYQHPFDNYKGQEVVIFEEFRSSLKIQDMLNYLDGYPLELPCRYANKVACFTKVYIITNIALELQYEEIQKQHIETWNALLRRITKVVYMTDKQSFLYDPKSYFEKDNKFVTLSEYDQEELPFK